MIRRETWLFLRSQFLGRIYKIIDGVQTFQMYAMKEELKEEEKQCLVKILDGVGRLPDSICRCHSKVGNALLQVT